MEDELGENSCFYVWILGSMTPHTVLMQAAYPVNSRGTLQRVNASCPSELYRSVLHLSSLGAT